MVGMTDEGVLNRVIDTARDEGVFAPAAFRIHPTKLKPVLEQEGWRMLVSEGEHAKWVDWRAINFISIGLADPEVLFDALREAAPNNAEDAIDRHVRKGDSGPLVNSPRPTFESEYIGHVRTRARAKALGALAGEFDDFDRQTNYNYRLYNVLARSSTSLRVAANLFGETKEFYVHREGPTELYVEREEEEKSAARSAADW